MTIEEFLGGPTFRYVIFPAFSAGSGILLKCATRHDSYAFFRKEDMAVGPQLMLTAALTYVIITTDRARELSRINDQLKATLTIKPLQTQQIGELQAAAYAASQPITLAAWLLLCLMLLLWGTVTIVKRWGWQSEAELKPMLGIALPLGLGVLSLMIVLKAAGR
ncbi:MAG: hypothetical protein EPO51_26175 [Phenylobacterium sp.]|uniref:hypothetical protein n=1 Tax=Phenylobacterium sp. TaxID=1871053 RepID=UPI001225E6C3|nr:hypothetical protein [Phenylobacterium sp.]TAJ69010.1 MAG: hypothetical protein EPO51_26175 [Phenylobacterium sp.]